jgi:hypothetical protein
VIGGARAVLDQTIPLAMPALFRKDAVNWDLPRH